MVDLVLATTQEVVDSISTYNDRLYHHNIKSGEVCMCMNICYLFTLKWLI